MAACYHAPSYSKEQSKILLKEIVGLINKSRKCRIWIGGDFNLPDIDWERSSHQYSNDISERFIEVTNDCYLEQLVTFPARGVTLLIFVDKSTITS